MPLLPRDTIDITTKLLLLIFYGISFVIIILDSESKTIEERKNPQYTKETNSESCHSLAMDSTTNQNKITLNQSMIILEDNFSKKPETEKKNIREQQKKEIFDILGLFEFKIISENKITISAEFSGFSIRIIDRNLGREDIFNRFINITRKRKTGLDFRIENNKINRKF